MRRHPSGPLGGDPGAVVALRAGGGRWAVSDSHRVGGGEGGIEGVGPVGGMLAVSAGGFLSRQGEVGREGLS